MKKYTIQITYSSTVEYIVEAENESNAKAKAFELGADDNQTILDGLQILDTNTIEITTD